MRIRVFFTIFVLSQCTIIVLSLVVCFMYIIQTYEKQFQTRVFDLEYNRKSTKDTGKVYENNSKHNLTHFSLKTKTSSVGKNEETYTLGSTKGFSDLNLQRNQRRKTINSDNIPYNLTDNVLFFETRNPVTVVNCRTLIEGDISEIRKAVQGSKMYRKRFILPKTYTSITNNCTKFKLKRGYITSALTKGENNFPIAFSLLMYKDVEQTERLLRAIYRPQNFYCIHVDLKARDTVYKAVRSLVNCFENVFTTRRRVNVTWGDSTVLEPDLLCMQELWDKSKTWKYFINLTGQEFPLRTNYELVKILSTFNGSNDIYVVKSDAFRRRLKGAGKPPNDIMPMKGEIHIVVSRAFVDFVLNDQRAQDFLNWTKLTRHSDETFYPSLYSNPYLQAPGSNKSQSFARFKNWGQCLCGGKYVRHVCIFGIRDLPLLASRFELFANKFHLDYHPFALDCMEELHFNRTREQYFGNVNFDTKRYSKEG